MSTTIFAIEQDQDSRSMKFLKEFKNSYEAKRFVKRNRGSFNGGFAVVEDNRIIETSEFYLRNQMITKEALEASRLIHSIFRVNKDNLQECIEALETLSASKAGSFLGGRLLKRYVELKEKGIQSVYNEYTFNKGVNAGTWGFSGIITEQSVTGTISDPVVGSYIVDHKVYNVNGVKLTLEALNGSRTK